MSTPPHLLIILTSVLVFASFAGCIAEDTPEHDDSDGHHGDDPGSGNTDNATGDPAPGTDGDNATGNSSGSAPIAVLSANVTEATAPAVVAFTVDGSDDDGDALEWTFDVDDDGTIDENGTSLPATVNITYEAAGNYTARLVVTDKDGSANATLDLVITAPDVGDGICHRPDAQAAGPLWIDDRGGGSIWIYLESNDIPGLQVGHAEEEDAYQDCASPDTLIF